MTTPVYALHTFPMRGVVLVHIVRVCTTPEFCSVYAFVTTLLRYLQRSQHLGQTV